MTPDKAKQIIIDGEGQTTEFKESFGQTRPAVETLCAFAHAEGGRLFFGVDDDRNVRGVEIGRRTLEQFAQTLRQETDPPLDVSISEILMEQGKSVVAIEVAEAARDQIIQAYGRFLIRIGRSNHRMPTATIRSRVLASVNSAEERYRPTFDVENGGFRNTAEEFEPEWHVKRVSGDHVSNVFWRVRGPRFRMDWRQARGSSLDRTRFAQTFVKTAELVQDDLISEDEVGFELKFVWQGRWRHELHRYELTDGRGWNVGPEKPPLRQWDGEPLE